MQSFSENVAIFFILFIFTLFKTWRQLNQNEKKEPGTYPFRFLTYFRQHTMVFSSENKAIIKNDHEEKGWTAYQICKEHKPKKWVLSFVHCFLVRFNEDGSMKRRTGSGRPNTIKTDESASYQRNWSD